MNVFREKTQTMDSPTQPIADSADDEADISAGFACDSTLATREDLMLALRGPLVIAAGRGAAPAGVLAEMARADRVHAELAAGGREVRFTRDVDGNLAIELIDRDGRLLAPLSVSEAIDIARGTAMP